MKKVVTKIITFNDLLKEYEMACQRCWRSAHGTRINTSQKLVSCLRANGCWKKFDKASARSLSKIAACLREHGFWTSPEVVAVGLEYKNKILRDSNELINFQKKINIMKQRFIQNLAKEEGFDLEIDKLNRN